MLRRGIIAFVIVLAIGVATYFIYMKSFDPKYLGEWVLVEGDQQCFTEVEFSTGPKDYKGTILKHIEGKVQTDYLGGHKIEDGKIVTNIFNIDNLGPIIMDHEKQGDQLHLSYEWETEPLQCTYELKE